MNDLRFAFRQLLKNPGFTAVAVLTLAVACGAEAQDSPANKKAASEESLVLRLVDPGGRPVPRAKIGTALNIFVTSEDRPPSTITMWIKGHRRTWPWRSDAEGQVLLTGAEASYREYFAWHEGRGLVGFVDIPPERPSPEVELRLEPACQVYGTVTSKGFAEVGYPITRSTTFLNRGGKSGDSNFYVVSEQNNYEFYLPSGGYHLQFQGKGDDGRVTQRQSLEFTVKSGQRELDLGNVDLSPDPLSLLFGKPAPELVGIKEWKNSQPLTLPNLRGKIIVLDFWGYWCSPCLTAMPELMELHDRFGKQGCVIIAVHDSSLPSVQEVDKRLEKVRKERWNGRDLPFAIALESEVPADRHGATHAAYAISAWPTTLLIDQNGVLVGRFNPVALQERIKQMLASPAAERSR